jgi:glycosyltransferase involved in cell wall biosynthesis
VTARNSPCPCGSGKRFKDCHGRLGADASITPLHDVGAMLNAALELQVAGRLHEADTKYREALAIDPDHPDGLHMLAVVAMELHRYRESSEYLLRALDVTNWRIPAMRHNLAILLGRVAGHFTPEALPPLARQYRQTPKRDPSSMQGAPLVSVVLPSYNHAAFITTAVESVFAQSYKNVELIAIDDGSSDQSPAVLQALARNAPIPMRVIARENRGAPLTLNEGASHAHGAYLQFLNSDDYFSVDRIEKAVAMLHSSESAWGFSRVGCVNAEGERLSPLRDRRAFDFANAQSVIDFLPTIGFGFLGTNPMISTGNCIVERSFFQSLNGFSNYRYNHDWDFALRALALSEPAYCDDTTYFYRFHGSNTITESAAKNRDEMNLIMRRFFHDATQVQQPKNPYYPCPAVWEHTFTREFFAGGTASALEESVVRDWVVPLLSKLTQSHS